MRSPGSPQSTFGLFGGPGFLVVCLLIVGIAGGIAYLALTGGLGSTGEATLSVPGVDVPPASNASAPTGAAQMKSMPEAPVAKEIMVSVAIEEDLSPTDLLTKYPPDPSARLSAGAEGLPAWRRFGRDSAISPEAPRVALVVTGLGRDRTDTVRAITGAPPEASLSFDSEARDLPGWIAAARAYGHEALLDVPLQAGETPSGLSPQLAPEENQRRLDALLARAPLIAGVTISGGDSFLADGAALQPLLKHLQAEGLAIVGLPVTAPLTIAADETIAGQATQAGIEQSIRSMKILARRRGVALGIVESANAASLFPAWYRALIGGDEISLVPVSTLVKE